MKFPMRGGFWCRISVGLLLITGASYFAPRVMATERPVPPPSSAGSPALAESPAPLSRFIRRLEARHRATVLAESTLRLVRDPGLPPADLALEAGLQYLVRVLDKAAWRRVYLDASSATQPLEPAELAYAVRMLERQVPKTLLIEDVAARRRTLLLKGEPVTAALPRVLSDRGLRPQPVELLFHALEPSGGTVCLSRLSDLQRQQLELSVGAEHQGLAYERMMQLLQALPLRQREDLVARTVPAGLRLWETTAPDQRREMMQQAFGALQRIGSSPPRAASPNSPARVSSERSHAPALVRIVRDRARRERALVVIDPDLCPANAPPPVAPELGLEDVLEAATAAQGGITWRRIYLPAEERQRIEKGKAHRELTAAAQWLDRLDEGSLSIEDVRLGSVSSLVTHRSTLDQASRNPFLKRHHSPTLDERPVYIVFNTTPSAQGASLVGRYDHLLRQQLDLFLRMDAGQTELAMEHLVRTHLASGPDDRARLTALPIMAALMATWFPRQAKEQP